MDLQTEIRIEGASRDRLFRGLLNKFQNMRELCDAENPKLPKDPDTVGDEKHLQSWWERVQIRRN